MKKLKCTSCGGNMTIDANNEYATCSYCGTKYKLNQDINLNLNLDEDIKETIIERQIFAKKFMIIPIIMFIVISVFMMYRFITFHNNSSFDVDNFNASFEMKSGKQSKFFINDLINDVITNNQKNKDKLITVKYDNIETTDIEEIIEIQNSLNESSYTVLFDYDKKGYINKVTLK